MAIVKKESVVQVRCRTDRLSEFEKACKRVNTKPTDRIRQLMEEDTIRMNRRADAAEYAAARAAEKAQEAFVEKKAAQVLPLKEKAPVAPLVQPQSLSDRRKAEKMAKMAKLARRENRYLDD